VAEPETFAILALTFSSVIIGLTGLVVVMLT
jgi:hypothetical protein